PCSRRRWIESCHFERTQEANDGTAGIAYGLAQSVRDGRDYCSGLGRVFPGLHRGIYRARTHLWRSGLSAPWSRTISPLPSQGQRARSVRHSLGERPARDLLARPRLRRSEAKNKATILTDDKRGCSCSPAWPLLKTVDSLKGSA